MKILIAEDEKICRKVLTSIMESIGECIVTESGGEAISQFTKACSDNERFDLVALDVEMPDFSGIEVLKQIRTIEKEKGYTKAQQTKAIMITSKTDEAAVLGSLKAGCDNYIVKPVTKERVLSKLSSIGFNLT